MPIKASITGQQEEEPGVFQNLLNSFGNMFARRQKIERPLPQIPMGAEAPPRDEYFNPLHSGNLEEGLVYPGMPRVFGPAPDIYGRMIDPKNDPLEGPEPEEMRGMTGEEKLQYLLDIWEPRWKQGLHGPIT